MSLGRSPEPARPARDSGAERAAAPDVNAIGARSVAIGGNVKGTTIVAGSLYDFVPARRYWLPLGIVAAILLIGAVVVIAQQVRTASTTPTRMLGGGTRVAIGALFAADPQRRDVDNGRAEDLSQALYSALNERTSGGVNEAAGETWPPSWTGLIDGAVRADQRAREIDADIVVYGSVHVGEDSTTVRPKFYISGRVLGAELDALAGEYELGAEIVSLGDFTRNSATFEDLKQRLVGRTDSLQQLLVGVAQYQRKDFAAAAAAFRKAEDQPAWEGRQGRELLYLFSGYTAAELRDASAAEHYFTLAQAFPSTRGLASTAARTPGN
jgi:hypothetical protein